MMGPTHTCRCSYCTRTLHRRSLRGLTACLLAIWLASVAHANLNTFNSRAYTIHTDLNRAEVLVYAEHMDKVFAEYQARFASFRGRRTGPMPLYLFRTQEGYQTFLASRGIDGTNSGGMFFVRAGSQGLATFVGDNNRARVFTVLQHEGFHQFAYNYIGPNLPIWVNEGLAQYFEDGIIVRRSMKLGIANKERIDHVRTAIEANAAIDFDRLLTISGEMWSMTLSRNPREATLLYAQSWSVVYFLIHGDNGRYRAAFEKYLQLVADGRDSGRAFREAFGSNDTAPFRQRWERYARDLQPDDLTTAIARMEFLSAGLAFLMEKNEPMPKDIDELKRRLREISFRITRSSHGLAEEMSSAEDANFVYPRGKAEPMPFRLLDAARNDLPPRVSAPGLKPEPTLIWVRDETGRLMSDIEYR
jgi:hypothetical protein